MTGRCGERNFVVWTREISIPRIGPSGFWQRIRKLVASGWCHIRCPLANCSAPICAAAASSVGTAADYLFQNRAAMRENRSCLLYTSDAADEEDSVVVFFSSPRTHRATCG